MENASKQNNVDIPQKKQNEIPAKNEQDTIITVTPDNDNGDPGPPATKEDGNKGQGPKGENL